MWYTPTNVVHWLTENFLARESESEERYNAMGHHRRGSVESDIAVLRTECATGQRGIGGDKIMVGALARPRAFIHRKK